MAAVLVFHYLLVLVQKEDLASDSEDLLKEILEKNLFVLQLDFVVLENLAKDLAELKDNSEKEIVDKEDNWDIQRMEVKDFDQDPQEKEKWDSEG